MPSTAFAVAIANAAAGATGKQAFITVPGLGCGQFTGKFMGRLGEMLQQTLLRLLRRYHAQLQQHPGGVFQILIMNARINASIGHLSFMVRPFNPEAIRTDPQLCPPQAYEEPGDDFSRCQLFSVVAWDHVSWPGNDFYVGARATDDGVKAAATSSMAAITGIEGRYNSASATYDPPAPYRNWEAVVRDNGLQLELARRLSIMPPVVGLDG